MSSGDEAAQHEQTEPDADVAPEDYDIDPGVRPDAEDNVEAALAGRLDELGYAVERSAIDVRFTRYRRWLSITRVHQNGRREPVGILPFEIVAAYLAEHDLGWVAHPDGLGLSS